jgi:hypothetical protein
VCNGDFPGFSSKCEVPGRVLSCAKVCLCTKKPDEGDCCLWCENHAGVTTRHPNDAVCYFEDCVRQEQETLLPCTACNSEYHKECHKFIWGRGPAGEPAPWCLECYADWKDEDFMNIHSTCLLSRGGYDTNYDPDARATARKHDALPPLRQRLGINRSRPKLCFQETLVSVGKYPCRTAEL